MAGSVNKVILVGNLGRDPEVRLLQDGNKVVHFSVATSERWKDRQSGDQKERTEWHRVVIFNERLAEIAERYLRKGAKVYLEGALQTRKWTGNDGQERYTTEIEATEMQMLGGRSSASSSGGEAEYGGSMPSAPAPSASRGAAPAKKAPSFEDMDDDIPF